MVIKSWERAGESGQEQGDSPRCTNLQERRDLGKRQLGGLEEERDRRPRGGGGGSREHEVRVDRPGTPQQPRRRGCRSRSRADLGTRQAAVNLARMSSVTRGRLRLRER